MGSREEGCRQGNIWCRLEGGIWVQVGWEWRAIPGCKLEGGGIQQTSLPSLLQAATAAA